MDKTYYVTFKDSAQIKDIVNVLNCMGMNTNNKQLIDEFSKNENLELLELREGKE